MKKSVNFGFITVSLIVGILSVGSVWAAGTNEGVITYCDVPRDLNYPNYQFLLGCDCATYGTSGDPEILINTDPYYFDFFRTNFGNILSIGSSEDGRDEKYYCYVDEPLSKIKPGTGSGKGHVRMCTEDSNSTYTTDYTGGNERNRECPSSTPFCNEDKYTCNECREDSDCSKTPFAQLSSDRILQAKCLLNNNLKTQSIKSCEYCVHINGTGEKKIVFIVGQTYPGQSSDEMIQSAYESIIGTEPFKYLHEQKNAFTFAYVPTNSDLFEIFNLRYYTSDRAYLTKNSEKKIVEKAEQVCGGDIIIVYIDHFNGKDSGYATKDNLIVLGNGNLEGNVITHELGHAIGDLADEYVLPYSRKNNAYQSNVVNIQSSDDRTAEKGMGITQLICPKFTDFGVNTPNCFAVWDNKRGANPGYRKSTADSLMNHNYLEYRFNVISCAGILNRVLGWGIKTRGVPYCTDTLTPEGYGIFPGIVPQVPSPSCSGKVYDSHNNDWIICKSNNFKWEYCLNPSDEYSGDYYMTFTSKKTGNEFLSYANDIALSQFTFCPNRCSDGQCTD